MYLQGPWRFPPGASISAVAWGAAAAPNVNHLRVYIVNENNEVIESAWEQGWNNGGVIVKGTSTDSAVTAIQWDSGRQIRVYFQRGLAVFESAFDNGHWNG